MFLFCSIENAVDRGVRRGSRMRCPTTGTGLERREAPGPSQGPRAPGPPPPWRALGPGFGWIGLKAGGESAAPGASRRSIPSFERDGKRETAGRPGRPNSKPGMAERWQNMDRKTLAAYDTGAAGFARDWHEQPPPADLHALVRRFFRAAGRTADIGCGSGREVAFLAVERFRRDRLRRLRRAAGAGAAALSEARIQGRRRCRTLPDVPDELVRQRAVRDGDHASAARRRSRRRCAACSRSSSPTAFST